MKVSYFNKSPRSLKVGGLPGSTTNLTTLEKNVWKMFASVRTLRSRHCSSAVQYLLLPLDTQPLELRVHFQLWRHRPQFLCLSLDTYEVKTILLQSLIGTQGHGWPVKKANRDLKILRRKRLRVRDFLNTEYCLRVNQRHFGGKTCSRRHSTTSFSGNVVVAETSYQILQVLSFCNRERA